MDKYTKKEKEITAIQFTGANEEMYKKLSEFGVDYIHVIYNAQNEPVLRVENECEDLAVNIGDYLIKSKCGFKVYDHNHFEQVYKLID